jgi:hypothetical protein
MSPPAASRNPPSRVMSFPPLARRGGQGGAHKKQCQVLSARGSGVVADAAVPVAVLRKMDTKIAVSAVSITSDFQVPPELVIG